MRNYIPFKSLNEKILNWERSKNLKICGIGRTHWPFFLKFSSNLENDFTNGKTQIIVTQSVETAESTYELLSEYFPSETIHFWPGLEHSPYSGCIPSERSVHKKFKILFELTEKKNISILVTTVESFLLKIPPKEFFNERSFKINVEDIIPPQKLSKMLVEFGHSPSISVEEPCTFSSKGEIFDLYPPSGGPLRIHYYDDMIESISSIDPLTNKTIKSSTHQQISVQAGPQIIVQKEYVQNLMGNIPVPSPQFKRKFEKRKEIINNLKQNLLFDDYPLYLALFFKNTQNLTDFFSPQKLQITILEEIECTHSRKKRAGRRNPCRRTCTSRSNGYNRYK
jgi:transcription-repair coupling factor (superfamily II helicase)